MTDIATDHGLLTQAYVYGFPLVFNLDQVTRYVTDGVGANPAAAFNTFSHARHLAGPADTFVTINNDTLYSMAQLDLSAGPVALHVPDTAGRYYVLQFVDAWTNNFAYVGHRATGTNEADFLLVPPGWTAEGGDDQTVIRLLMRSSRSTLSNGAARPCCPPRRDAYQSVAPCDIRSLPDAGSPPEPPWVAFCRRTVFN